MAKKVKILGFLFLLVIVFLPLFVQAATPQETLKQYIADLQKNPTDTALREKIIRHVQRMKPQPAIPAEAERYEGRAEFAIKNAKSEADFLDAAKEYEKALLIVPWVSAYYFNQGVAYEKAGKPKEAKQSFEFYIIAAPNARDARDVRKRIGGLEYALEKKVSSPSTDKQKSNLDLSGRWIYEGGNFAYCNAAFHHEFQLDGDKLIGEQVFSESYTREIPGCGPVSLRGQRNRMYTLSRSDRNEFSGTNSFGTPYKIEFIGDKAFETAELTNGPSTTVYQRQR